MLKIVFLFLFAFFFIFPSNVFSHSEVAVVEMVPDGFVPSEITIDVNSSVIFINKDSQPRWPASNVHPTHDLYPEFDPRHNIDPGQSWAFKPTRVGEWKFHDHLFPHMRGVLKVIDEEGSDVKTLEKETKPVLNIFVVRLKDVVSNFFNKIKTLFTFKKISNQQLPNKEGFKKLSYGAQSKELEKIAKCKGAPKVW